MSESALRQCSKVHALKMAWDELYRNSTPRSRQTRGIDGVSLNDFAASRDASLRELSRLMQMHGGYQFSPLVAALVPKKDDRYRIICIPTVGDRVVQRSIVNFLSSGDKCGLENSVSYGFIPGRSVKQAVRRAKNLRKKHRWVYKTDITQFFDNIPRSELSAQIEAGVAQPSLHELLAHAAACEIRELNKRRRDAIEKAGIRVGEGVRQGMPLSPFFANVLLRDFDRMIEANHFHMVRYADDLIVLCDSEAECRTVHAVFKEALGQLGLSIPEPGPSSKTTIHGPGEPAEFLGVGLVPNGAHYSLNVMKSQTQKIRSVIREYRDFDRLCRDGITIGKLTQKLGAVCDGYLAAYEYCDNVKQLAQAMDTERRAVLTAIYENGLGISMAGMSEHKRVFLGLGS